jgi:acylpyruvate hydrolase
VRLATIRTASGTRAARLEGEELVLLRADDVGALLAEPDRVRATNDETGESVPLASAEFATLVPQPTKTLWVGLNYRDHLVETGTPLPTYPTLFSKFTEALIGAHDDIVLPSVSDEVDWEVELCVVIGRAARHVRATEALSVIAGYTVANDISVRDYQLRTHNSTQGKTFERTTPVGPFLVTGDEVDDALDLEVGCEVDGELVQHDRTSELVFSSAELVSYCSDIVTLKPGDLISTGTPGGVGFTRQPPRFLNPGQVVRTFIEGLGECRNACTKEAG